MSPIVAAIFCGIVALIVLAGVIMTVKNGWLGQ